MPWHIAHNVEGCSGYAVVQDSNSKIVGCHKTKQDAERQLAALHINVHKWDGAFIPLDTHLDI